MNNMLKVNYKQISAMSVHVTYVKNEVTLVMLHKVLWIK